MHALCPPLSGLCLMSLALCGPVGFYLLFVLDIWCGVVAWIALAFLISCAICRHVLHFCNLLHASCMHSALHCLASASCHWHCVVLLGFTFFLSQTSGVALWHGLRLCCCPLVLFVNMCCMCVLMCCLSVLLTAALYFFCCLLLPSDDLLCALRRLLAFWGS